MTARALRLLSFVADPAPGGAPRSPSDELAQSARSIWQTTLDGVPRVGVALAIVVLGWGLSRATRAGLQRVFARRRTPSFARVMSKVIGWVVLTIVVLLAVAITFPSVKPVNILAGLGFFSVAVGFAFQDILENTLAGILLLFRQPFRSGDQIEVVGRSGTVSEINIRETRLVTFDGEVVVIPNRDVYKGVIVVNTAFERRRLEFQVGIAYENDPAEAIEAVVAALAGVPAVSDDPPPTALVDELGPSTVRIRALFWASSQQADSVAALDAAIQAVKAALDAAGIELPADVLVLQAAPSFKAAIQGGAEVTPGGGVRPLSGQ